MVLFGKSISNFAAVSTYALGFFASPQGNSVFFFHDCATPLPIPGTTVPPELY